MLLEILATDMKRSPEPRNKVKQMSLPRSNDINASKNVDEEREL